jgi:hypothetical protein
MSIHIKKNQALAFGPGGPDGLPCNCGGNYCQPVQTNDTLHLQGTVTEEGANLCLLQNWNYEAGWFTANGKIYGKIAPLDTAQAISNRLGLQGGQQYSVYIDANTLAVQSYVAYGDVEFNGAHVIAFPGAAPDAALYNPGDKLYITGTAYNNGIYTVVSAAFVSGTVVITTLELNTAEGPVVATLIKAGDYSPLPDDGYRFKLNGNYLPLPVVAPDESGAATSAAYLLHWNVAIDTVVDDYLRIESTNPELLIIINAISIKRLSRVGVAVYQGHEVYMQLDNPTGLITYYPEHSFISNVSGTANLTPKPVLFNATINFATFAGTVVGCSQLAFYNSAYMANQVLNGSFDEALNHWQAGSYWSFADGKAVYNPPLPDAYAAGMLTQTVVVPGGGVYQLGFTVSGVATIFNAAQVWYRINGGDLIPVGYYFNGSFTAAIDLTAYAGAVNLTLAFGEYNPSAFALDSVSLVRLTPDTDNLSNCIEVRAQHDCTLLFNAQNNDNAFGFDYAGGFQHTLRIKAKMDVTAYPEETDTPYIFSNNNRVLLFARRDKEYTIFTADAPVHIHDCLTHLRLHDTFRIGTIATTTQTNLVEYIKESAYELNRRKTSALKQAIFTVREKQGLASNFGCG